MGARSVPYPISILIGSGRASANNRIEGNGTGKGGGKRKETTRCRRGSLGWRARRVSRPGAGVHLPQRTGGFAPCSSVPLLCGTSLRTRRIPGARGGSPPFLSEIPLFGSFIPFPPLLFPFHASLSIPRLHRRPRGRSQTRVSTFAHPTQVHRRRSLRADVHLHFGAVATHEAHVRTRSDTQRSRKKRHGHRHTHVRSPRDQPREPNRTSRQEVRAERPQARDRRKEGRWEG